MLAEASGRRVTVNREIFPVGLRCCLQTSFALGLKETGGELKIHSEGFWQQQRDIRLDAKGCGDIYQGH